MFRLTLTAALVLLAGGALADESLLAGREAEWRSATSLEFTNPTPLTGDGDRYRLWIESGWLNVSRRTSEGHIDWWVALAREIGDEVPVVQAPKAGGILRVSYASGRYFLREDVDTLRGLLEQVSGAAPSSQPADATWPNADLRCSSGDADSTLLEGRSAKGWFTVEATSARIPRWTIRLAPDDAEHGYGAQAMGAGGLRRVFCGKHYIFFEGDLLFAVRKLEAQARFEQNRDKLVGAATPDIDGKWINSDPMAMEDLKGKVVLLDFWATWCAPCMAKLPDVKRHHDKYHGQGLVVVGVHAPNDADDCESVVKENQIRFPVLVATTTTEQDYGITEYPTYLLVGKDGRIVAPHGASPPADEQIEELLGKQ